jgi:DNA repair photolyase
MPLNKSTGNMYDFVSHTWNTVKGQCYHDCSYCYIKAMNKRYKKEQTPVRFDEKELKTNLGKGNFIFVGSSCDMWSVDINDSWIQRTLEHCNKFDNRYLFQSKNPKGFNDYIYLLPKNPILCTTIESDMFYPEIMGNSPHPMQRSIEMNQLYYYGFKTFVTIEPILDFNLEHLITMIRRCKPSQVNIGSDSSRNGLPEPPKEKVLELISELEKFTTIHNKTNLKRLLL